MKRKVCEDKFDESEKLGKRKIIECACKTTKMNRVTNYFSCKHFFEKTTVRIILKTEPTTAPQQWLLSKRCRKYLLSSHSQHPSSKKWRNGIFFHYCLSFMPSASLSNQHNFTAGHQLWYSWPIFNFVKHQEMLHVLPIWKVKLNLCRVILNAEKINLKRNEKGLAASLEGNCTKFGK